MPSLTVRTEADAQRIGDVPRPPTKRRYGPWIWGSAVAVGALALGVVIGRTTAPSNDVASDVTSDVVTPVSSPATTAVGEATRAPEPAVPPTTIGEITPTTQPDADRAVVPGIGIWLSLDQIEALPTSGPAWEQVASYAEAEWGEADLSDNTNRHDVHVFAAALYAVRLDDRQMADRVVEALDEITGDQPDYVLAMARNLSGYVIAADLVGYRTPEFEAWLVELLDLKARSRAGIETLRESALYDPSNHGTHARASVLGVGLYLGDDALITTMADRFHDWLGRSSSDFEWRDLSWQADPDQPAGINPAGARIDGVDVDGVLPEEQRRSGYFTDEPEREGYVWEALQGAIVTAELLDRAGYEAWVWEDDALLRAVEWLHDEADFPAEGDDTWQPWLVNDAYGAAFPVISPSRPGKNLGFTDWTHGS